MTPLDVVLDIILELAAVFGVMPDILCTRIIIGSPLIHMHSVQGGDRERNHSFKI